MRHVAPDQTVGCLRRRVMTLAMAVIAINTSVAGHESGDTSSLRQNSNANAWHLGWATPARAEGKPTKGTARYTCPMHPHYISDHPGSCPICGMDLVKAAASDGSGTKPGGDERSEVTIPPETLQNMGVRLARAERTSFGRVIRASGLVMENERARSVVTARVEGWIEELSIAAVGDPVKKGAKLFELYAPELVVSQRDYLLAMRQRDEVRRASTENRLRSFGVQDEVLRLLARDGRELQRVPFYADRDGLIAELPVANGEYVKRGSTILRIQNYETIWINANIAEKDLGLLKLGTPARATLVGLTGQSVEARIDFIHPTIDPKTRTGRVRLIVRNDDGAIRPGSFADIEFEIGEELRLAIPSEAILRNEAGPYVVISLGEGRFQPRAVRVGLVRGRWTEILQGIDGRQQVVVSGQFMIDSESTLRETFRKLERMQMPLSLLQLDATQLAMIDHMVDAALYLHEAVTDGYAIEPKFLDPAREVADSLRLRFGSTKLGFVLNDAAKAIAAAQTSRSDSETLAALDGLVKALLPWMRDGAPRHYTEKQVSLLQDGASGRHWLQRAGRHVNPYGKSSSTLLTWPVTDTPEMKLPAPSPAPSEALKPAHNHKTPG